MAESVTAEYVIEVKETRYRGGTGIAFGERRERVVRCRDCEHASPCPLADSEKLMCAFHDEMFVSPGDFCSWGEPMESGADDQD